MVKKSGLRQETYPARRGALRARVHLDLVRTVPLAGLARRRGRPLAAIEADAARHLQLPLRGRKGCGAGHAARRRLHRGVRRGEVAVDSKAGVGKGRRRHHAGAQLFPHSQRVGALAKKNRARGERLQGASGKG